MSNKKAHAIERLKTPNPCIAIDRVVSINEPGISVVKVPILSATPQNFANYGRIVEDFSKEQIIIRSWPSEGGRPIESGTGNQAGTVEDDFLFYRQGDQMIAHNLAVDGHYVTGWFTDPLHARESGLANSASSILVREANYHPDGGQLFFPKDGQPFIALLALPGDDVKPEDFIAFYCDGSFGIQIFPNIWHQPVFPLAHQATFLNRQGRVHACVAVDFVTEFNCYLSVPLVKPQV